MDALGKLHGVLDALETARQTWVKNSKKSDFTFSIGGDVIVDPTVRCPACKTYIKLDEVWVLDAHHTRIAAVIALEDDKVHRVTTGYAHPHVSKLPGGYICYGDDRVNDKIYPDRSNRISARELLEQGITSSGSYTNIYDWFATKGHQCPMRRQRPCQLCGAIIFSAEERNRWKEAGALGTGYCPECRSNRLKSCQTCGSFLVNQEPNLIMAGDIMRCKNCALRMNIQTFVTPFFRPDQGWPVWRNWLRDVIGINEPCLDALSSPCNYCSELMWKELARGGRPSATEPDETAEDEIPF